MKINANGTEISVIGNVLDENTYISLTDLARYKNPYEPKDVVKNWLWLRSTIEFWGLWEQLYNPDFKGVEFDTFKTEAGSNAFTLTPQRWIESTNADMIHQGIPAEDRIQKSRNVAYYQLNSLKSGKFTAKLNKKIQCRLEQK